jgi:hypothetical protein
LLIDPEKMGVLPFKNLLVFGRGFRRDEPAALITGFNTDIKHEGVVYHVQTEDKGLDSPIILSLVYAGGAILASKRSPYEDLIKQGFSDELLAERLKRQHRLICAAIHSGRINDLKKMSGRDTESPARVAAVEAEVEEAEVEIPALELEIGSKRSQEYQPPPPPEETVVETEEEEETLAPPPAPVGAYRISKHGPAPEPPPQAQPEPPQPQLPLLEEGLVVRLLDANEFYSGDSPTLRVLVTDRVRYDENPIPNASVSIKILGTTFRPLIYTVKTQRDGIASLSTQIPQFSSGRAAVLIRAMVKDQAAELRCVIHPNK